jgi:hypothetical protein
MDTQAVGMWGFSGLTATDANGAVGSAGSDDDMPLTSANCYGLIGYVGSPPAPTFGGSFTTGVFNSDPKCFMVGNTLTNYQLPSAGDLNFMSNTSCNTTYGTGQQLVRIIVTR